MAKAKAKQMSSLSQAEKTAQMLSLIDLADDSYHNEIKAGADALVAKFGHEAHMIVYGGHYASGTTVWHHRDGYALWVSFSASGIVIDKMGGA